MKQLFIILSIFIGLKGYGQSEDTLFLKSIIQTLASEEFGGRPTSTLYETMAADYIMDQFDKINRFEPRVQHFKYKINSDSVVKSSKNIYCYINNKADSTVVLMAHYDHLGDGEGLSRSLGKKGVHPGADDNASGVALLLSLARDLDQFENKKYNYLFLAPSAHEIGLFGSAQFVKSRIKRVKPIALVVNFDMVGRLSKEVRVLNIYGKQTLQDRATALDGIEFDGKIYTDEGYKIEQTDCKWFLKYRTPCLSFTTGLHNDYHKISDTEEKINYTGLCSVQKYVTAVMRALAR